MHFYHKFLINSSAHLSVHPVFYLDLSTLVYTSTIRFYKFSYIFNPSLLPTPQLSSNCSLPLTRFFSCLTSQLRISGSFTTVFLHKFSSCLLSQNLLNYVLEVITTSMVEMQQMFEEHLGLLASISLFSHHSQNSSLSLTWIVHPNQILQGFTCTKDMTFDLLGLPRN